MDKPAIAVCEAYAKAGYPLDVEALLIVEVEGSRRRSPAALAHIVEIAQAYPAAWSSSREPEQSARIWKGRKAAFGAIGRISDYYCMDGTIPLSAAAGGADVQITQICRQHGLKVANVFHAGDGNLHPLILYNANDAGRGATRRAGRRRDPEAVRRGRRLPHRRAWRRHREARPDDVQFSAADLALQMRIKTVFDPQWLLNPAKVFPLDGAEARRTRRFHGHARERSRLTSVTGCRSRLRSETP